MKEKISIIVPAYNIENFIENTVKSIRQQTYCNLEIILVDDGSTDGTPQIIDRLETEDERIRVIHKKNGGVTSARFAGIEAATGDWIGFVDGDDYIEPDMYEHLLDNAHKYHADVSHCGYQMVFPSRIDYYYNTGRVVEQDKTTGLKDLLEGSFVEPGLCNKLFHKPLFHRLLHDGKMDFSIKNMEDLLMNFYLFQQSEKLIYEDICPYHYMLRKGSAATSRLNENKLRDPLCVFKAIETETQDDFVLQNAIRRRILSMQISYATMPLGEQAELIRPYRAMARHELRANFLKILKGEYSKKQKVMALWAAIWPASYSWVHCVYAELTGTDKKYEVK